MPQAWDLQGPETIRGDRLKNARKGAGLTQKEVARILGLPRKVLSRVENHGDAKLLSLPHLEIMSRLYDMPLEYFLQPKSSPALEVEDSQTLLAYAALRRKMIGVLLRQARLARGKTLHDLACEVDLSAEDLGALEFGEAEMPLPKLFQLGRACGLRLSQLVNADLISFDQPPEEATQVFERMAPDVQAFVAQPSNVLYIRVAMLLSELSVDTLRKIGEGLLDITL